VKLPEVVQAKSLIRNYSSYCSGSENEGRRTKVSGGEVEKEDGGRDDDDEKGEKEWKLFTFRLCPPSLPSR
jgi:hypothetical protein